VTEGSATYRTRDFRALDFDFTVETDHAGLAQYLDSAFAALATGGNASHVARLNVAGADSEARVMIDDRTLSVPPGSAYLLPTLMSAVNRAVVDASTDRLLVHASAVEADGRAILFPAPMEAGKSTLAAGLLRAGYRYVTDEAVAIDLATLEVQPYPRPISLDRGAWPLFADLRPATPKGVERFCTEQWHISPLDIRPDAIARPSRPGVVAFPRYAPEKRTQARTIERSQALCELVGCAFNLDGLGAPAFDTLARVVTTSPCYRFTVSDLGRACDVVGQLARAKVDAAESFPEVVVDALNADTLAGSAEPGDQLRAIDARFAVARRPGLAWVMLDRVVVYDPDTGRVVRLNTSGSLLWQVLDGETPLRDLAADIAAAYGSSRATIEADVVGLAKRLAQLDLPADSPRVEGGKHASS
jgi:Coenzyme PQQ synthesis protein D (PqqD)